MEARIFSLVYVSYGREHLLSNSIFIPTKRKILSKFLSVRRNYFFSPLGPLMWLFSIVPTPPNSPFSKITFLSSLNRLLFLPFLVTATVYFRSH